MKTTIGDRHATVIYIAKMGIVSIIIELEESIPKSASLPKMPTVKFAETAATSNATGKRIFQLSFIKLL